MNEEDIKIFSFNNKFIEQYRKNKPKIIEEENLEKLIEHFDSDKIIMKTQIIDKFIIMISIKTKNQLDLENNKVKEIQISSFNISIIKYNSKTQENQQININIPIKGEIKISQKDFFNQKFYFFDLVPIDEIKSFFYLCIFNQIHFFKLYEKEEKLKYNKIKIKNFNNEINILYLGKNLNIGKNILEIKLLLKPNNIFYFIPIDITNENIKLEEKEFVSNKIENQNIFNKFIRSDCGISIFIDKKNNQKFIASTKDETNEIIISELNINNLEKNSNDYLKILSLIQINYKIFIFAEIQKKEDESEYLTFGIYRLIFIEKDNNYTMELLQLIKIMNNEVIKEYNFNINISNYIYINLGEKIFFIHLDQNGIIDMINFFQLDIKKLNIKKYYYEKSQELSLFILFIDNEIFISKFVDEFYKEEKFIINENKNDKENQEKNDINQKENDLANKKELINIDSSEQNEEILPGLKADIIEEENNFKNDIKNKISKIIKGRIEINKDKINKLIADKKKKIKLVNEDIKRVKEEYKDLKIRNDNIIKVIRNLTKKKIENNNYYYEEEGEEDDQEKNTNYIINNSYNPNSIHFGINQNFNNQTNLINQMNNSQKQNMNFRFQNYSFNNNQINNQYQLNQFYPKGNMIKNNINNNTFY